MKKVWWYFIIIIIFVLIGVVSLLVWGSTTNWGKSFNAEEASRYCYTLCVNLDKIKYCTPNLIVNFEGGKWENVNCANLVSNNIAGSCSQIECP